MPKKYNDAEETSYTEPRYINANILIDLATHEGAYGYVDVHDIRNTPTADVVERKRGKWIITDTDDCYCSECKKDPISFVNGSEFWWLDKMPNFCPECGADMRSASDIGDENEKHN